ncbi:MAG: inositol monophosphatase family protein [Candidatus Bipolaricaulota bacterium]|nr:inositol monophosphatase family protein [Candidatus Bipolaricaulota bacterium]
MEKERALEVAVRVAREVGAILRAGVRAEKHASTKSHRHDPVTIYDRHAEQWIVSAIKDAFPEHGILSEEGMNSEGSSPYRWIIDPIDGTNNFLCGYPQFSISIALSRGDELQVACIYDPLRDELFSAIVGEGAYLDGVSLRVSPQKTLDGSLIGVGFSSQPERALRTHAAMKPLLFQARAVRAAGSACLDLAYVAAGRLDAAWYLSLSPWDVAAGILLIREAGGRVSDLCGDALIDPETGILATNKAIHAEMLGAIGIESDE